MDETQTAQPEAQEVFEFKNPVTHKTITLPKKLGDVDMKQLIEGVIQVSRTEKRASYEQQIAELSEKASAYEETKRRLEELESTTMSVSDRAKKDAERAIKEAEANRAKAEKYRSDLHNERLSNAIYKEASKNPEIFNIDQALRLFQAECAPRIIENGDELRMIAHLDGNEANLGEAFEKWIAKDSNANLLKNRLAPGGGSAGGQRGQPTNSMSKSQFDAMSNDDKFAFINNGGKLTE